MQKPFSGFLCGGFFMELRKSSRSSSKTKTGSDGKNSAEIYNAGLFVDGCSIQRRFSPRLHKTSPSVATVSSRKPSSRPNFIETPQCYLVDSSPESKSCKSQTPTQNVVTGSEVKTPDVVCGVPNFERRLSPRLNRDLTSEKQRYPCGNSSSSSAKNPDLGSGSVNQMQRRLSPRLHQSPQDKVGEDKSKESTLERRLSPRLHCHVKDEKQTPIESAVQRRVSPRFTEKQKVVPDGCFSKKRSHSGSHTNDNLRNAKRSRCGPPKEDGCEGTGLTANNEAKMGDTAHVAVGRSTHARMKETMKIFNAYYLQFILEEEERRKESKTGKEKNSKALKSKVLMHCWMHLVKKRSEKKLEMDANQTPSRPDLKAVYKMKQRNEILYPDKRIGHVPGIEVGYQFFSRAEMVVTGFHSHWVNGIDFIERPTTEMDGHEHYTFPIAVAIVMSGQSEDDLDNSEGIINTGHGGRDLFGGKLRCASELLVRGNLAMKNSMKQSIPIRVIRGHRNGDSYSGRIYTYDGLYKVLDTWGDKGQSGQLIYKYHLKRIEGQPKLTTNQVLSIRGCKTQTSLELPGLVCHDISNGQEAFCIPVTNLFDDAVIDNEFTYITTSEVAETVTLPPPAAGCVCKGNCSNAKVCACAKLNGSDFPYVDRDDGRLVEAKDVVFECGPSCKCGSGCLNRTSQRGIKYRLEVYRTRDKGWAVRSWDFIPSGALVCEYIGVVRRSDEVDNISGNDYIFEIDCWHTMNEIEGRERRFGSVPVSATKVFPKIDDKMLDSAPEFCIDAGSRGNVARFINHSCEPNLFVQCILSSHHDLRLARLALFAADDIPPLQELTYDYGYAVDSVIGTDGKVKVLPCFCGTADCRKRLY